ncbi:MAG: 1-deoxy-D-xylulose-5-phosphate reductoisomerase [Bacillota bacterium]
MKDLILLGSTGSIGEQTLDVLDKLDDWNLKGISCYKSIDKIKKQAIKFKPDFIAINDESDLDDLKNGLPENYKPEILIGSKGFAKLAALNNIDMVINAIVGAAGLEPSYNAILNGNKLGLANKESLVIGGSLIIPLAKENNVDIIPIDSEHNAIFQLLKGEDRAEVSQLILTASGGPFYGFSPKEIGNVTVEDALNHPNWNMGSKISIDSATLMNKGLEVIEAHWLFDYSYDKIDVIIHPQSIIHSMIELIDGSILAELGTADMRTPIQYALKYPDRGKRVAERLSLKKIGKLEFDSPDLETFPALKMAYESGQIGKGYPIVLNAANEIAVNAFLNKKIKFKDIPRIISKMLDNHNPRNLKSLSEILELNRTVRKMTEEVVSIC